MRVVDKITHLILQMKKLKFRGVPLLACNYIELFYLLIDELLFLFFGGRERHRLVAPLIYTFIG